MLCFGLTNAPAAFSRLISSLFQELNGECVVLFLDDLLVYSKTEEEHKIHLRKVFEILRRHKLYAKRSKCAFGVAEVEFLGHNVSAEGVSMQDRIVNAVLEWPQPRSVKHVQSFVGLANYYRRFIKGFAKIMQPITDIRRCKIFRWTDECEVAFQNIKSALTSAPVLAHARGDPIRCVNRCFEICCRSYT